MAIVTTLSAVKSIAQDDAFIQTLNTKDEAVKNVFIVVDQLTSASKFGSKLGSAQMYLAAHLLTVANIDSGGRGPLSSESIGGISKSFTLPYLNQKSVIASTQYGLMFIEIKRRSIVNVMVV